MANPTIPPTYAPVVLYDENAKDAKELLKSAKINPIWLKWFLDAAASINSVSSAIPGLVPYTGATTNVDLGTHSLSMASGAITGAAGAGYLDFFAQSANPVAPAAGTLRFHSATTQGFTRFEQDNEALTNLVLGRDDVYIAKNTSGGNLTKGTVVYITGSTGNVPNIAAARANSLTTLPCMGICLDTINNNNFGQVMFIGIISSIDTSAFSTGDPVWVSTSSAGGLQNTRPSGTSAAYVQRVGSVLVSGVGNGSILVDIAPFIGNMETGSVNSLTLKGFTDGSTASAGQLGELIDSSVTAQTVTTASPTNLTSIALTAGDWDVSGVVESDNFGINVYIEMGISQTSATFAGTQGKDWLYASANTSGAVVSAVIPKLRVNLSGNATVYLVARTSNADNAHMNGYICARRVR